MKKQVTSRIKNDLAEQGRSPLQANIKCQCTSSAAIPFLKRTIPFSPTLYEKEQIYLGNDQVRYLKNSRSRKRRKVKRTKKLTIFSIKTVKKQRMNEISPIEIAERTSLIENVIVELKVTVEEDVELNRWGNLPLINSRSCLPY
ncbi:hypothetical protein Fmac_017815 [Flemingia macrophylla]|uniref:Uncharacterized protein n=1 Tax=Flemingia macrophylla TaxID=520843 RepID=A0ABD1M371_9FABA